MVLPILRPISVFPFDAFWAFNDLIVLFKGPLHGWNIAAYYSYDEAI